ncbi:MAG: beta-galactosidase [Panacibacter sp.]
MLLNKIFLGAFCLFFITLCSDPANNAQSNDSEKENALNNGAISGTNNASGPDIVYGTNGSFNNMWGVWGGGELSSADMAKYSFFKGWYIVYQWKKLEPQKGNFDWDYFDSQMKFAADNNLSIGFMVWVGPHSPQWLFDAGVPLVSTQTKKKRNDFPYYLDKFYKERYYNMLQQVADHVKKMPTDIRKKVVMWMSAEGSTGDVTPYKGYPNDSKYNITEQQWFDYKKDVWTYMYKICQSEKPRINLLVNQGNSGQYYDWLTTNLPKVWMKAGNISHTYQFNGEQEYFNRLKKLEAKLEEDSMANRLRGEITVQGKWFNQNESWNMYALLTSALHFGLDIFNTAPKYLQFPTDTITFKFFNFYAGQKIASKSPGAFCVLKDALDAADTKRFPESRYGPVIDPANMDSYTKQLQRKSKKDAGDDDDGDQEGINASNIKNDNLSETRISKILQEYASYGAKKGDMTDLDNDSSADYVPEIDNEAKTTTRSGKPISAKRQEKMATKQTAKGGNGDKGTSFQKKREANMVINDIGVNLIPDNYYRFLTQYSPNTTSRGYWRVGPGDQPYGRFARGFDSKSGMTEMYFALDKNFFKGSTSPLKVGVRIIYLDKGNGLWSFNYTDGNGKKEAFKVNCNNSGNWITKSVIVEKAVFMQKLEHDCDVSIKYLSGDNTIFNSIEILR